MKRRTFLKIGLAAGGTLMVAPAWSSEKKNPPYEKNRWQPEAWLEIDSEEQVTITIHKAEMGQGVQTALAVLVAEELKVPWEKVRTRWAPASDDYHEGFSQVTGASNSVLLSWMPLRRLGAGARHMLVSAAAARWGVAASQCSAADGKVTHGTRQLPYSALLKEAMEQPLPEKPELVEPSQWKLIGKKRTRLDARGKVTGQAVFGPDVRLPGMLFAQLAQPPRFGSRIEAVDDTAARAVKGVRDVAVLKHPLRDMVFVVADHTYAAGKGLAALNIAWKDGPLAQIDDAELARRREALFETRKDKARPKINGNPQEALAKAERRLEVDYRIPYQAHLCMSPMSATARFRDGVCEVWAPIQNMTRALRGMADILSIAPEKIIVNNTYLGGGFGRRLFPDYAIQAAWLAKHLGKPVQLLWDRENDLKQAAHHPATICRMSGGVDEQGKPVAWFHQVAALSHFGPILTEGMDELNYKIPNSYMAAYCLTRKEPLPVMCGPYRSVGRLHNVFARECFMDELAVLTNKDPYRFRRDLLGEKPRLAAVLDRLAKEVDWSSPTGKGSAWGLAINADGFPFTKGFYTRGAAAARIKVDDNGKIRLTHMVFVVDCGIVIDPDTVEAQVKGGAVFGLNTVFKGSVKIRDGAVTAGNFDGYPLMRMSETPDIRVILLPREEAPTGVGEIAVPITLAAVCNAVYRATGKRVRELPMDTTQPFVADARGAHE